MTDREKAIVDKWFSTMHPLDRHEFLHTATLLESMSQEIERLKAKLAKQDD